MDKKYYYKQSDIRGEELPDFACDGYRFYHDYEDTCKYWESIKDIPDERQYYNQGTLIFKDITELQATIFRLQELAKAVNTQCENRIIKKEIGDNGINYEEAAKHGIY